MCSASTKHDYAHTKTLMQTEELLSNCLLKSVNRLQKTIVKSPSAMNFLQELCPVVFTQTHSRVKSLRPPVKNLYFAFYFQIVFHNILVIETSPFCLYDLKFCKNYLKTKEHQEVPTVLDFTL